MKSLPWLGVVLGVLVIIALGLRVLGASRWAELMKRSHPPVHQIELRIAMLSELFNSLGRTKTTNLGDFRGEL